MTCQNLPCGGGENSLIAFAEVLGIVKDHFVLSEQFFIKRFPVVTAENNRILNIRKAFRPQALELFAHIFDRINIVKSGDEIKLKQAVRSARADGAYSVLSVRADLGFSAAEIVISPVSADIVSRFGKRGLIFQAH